MAIDAAQIIPSPAETPSIAASLASAGFPVFPVQITQINGRRTKRPLIKGWTEGAATVDPSLAIGWFDKDFGDFPTAWIGVFCAGAHIVVIDVDDKDGRNGFTSLTEQDADLPTTFSYASPSGGVHLLYEAPEGVGSLTIGSDVTGPTGQPLVGVDIRAGNGLMVYYGPALDARPEMSRDVPAWALIPKKDFAGKNYSGTMRDWLDELVDGDAEPGFAALKALERVRSEGMTHADLLKVTSDIVRCGANGDRGIRTALARGRAVYTLNYPDHGKAWDDAVAGSIEHHGPVTTFMSGQRVAPVTPIVAPPKPDSAPVAGVTALQPKPVPVTPNPQRWEDHTFGPADVFVQTPNGRPRLDPTRLAYTCNPDGDLARGVDGQVWVYDHGRFVRDDDIIKRRVVQTMDDRYTVGQPALARDVVLMQPGFPTLPDCPPDQSLINVTNGMFEWKTGRLLPHSPSYLSTVQLPVKYDPNATCPKFDAWLAGVGDADLVASAWEVIAYSILPGNPFQKAAAIVGRKHTGKGTFIRILHSVIGEQNISHVSVKGMAERFPPAELYGKLLNTVGDHPTGFVGDASEFKQLTGDDVVRAEFKNQNAFVFKPWCFSVFGMNDLPTANDPSGGWLRRWTILRFDQEQPIGGGFLEESLYAERDGIFAKAMRVLPGLVAQARFTDTMQGGLDLADLAERADVVLSWLADDEAVLEKEPGNYLLRVKRAYAWSVYQAWSRETGHKGTLTRNNFFKRLYALGYTPVQSNGWWIQGLRLDEMALNRFDVTGGGW